jgi:hypothetical protein
MGDAGGTRKEKVVRTAAAEPLAWAEPVVFEVQGFDVPVGIGDGRIRAVQDGRVAHGW